MLIGEPTLAETCHTDERVALSTRTLADFEGKVDFYVVQSKIDTEPEILAGIDLNEIMTKE